MPGLRPAAKPPEPTVSDVDRSLTEQGISAYKLLWNAELNLPSSLPVMSRLATRDDGPGYYARLSLAQHFTQDKRLTEALNLIREAISMRKLAEPESIAPLHQATAALLEQTGDGQGAFEAWGKLLPRADALAAVRRLAPDRKSVV
mgnify:CR=1 FL=1